MTTSITDPYREWDAAYVMGSLSTSERHEYEEHLAHCLDCSHDVGELAGLSGILAVVSTEDAHALLAEDGGYLDGPPDPNEGVPPDLLANILERAELDRVVSRRRIGPVAVRVLAVAASIAVAVSLVVWGVSLRDDHPAELLTMAQTVPSPVTADAKLVSESWGTTIQLTCRYARPESTAPASTAGSTDAPSLGAPPFAYALYVTDTAGVEQQVGSWVAGPGSVVHPTATTSLTVDQIRHIDVRFVPLDAVILTVQP